MRVHNSVAITRLFDFGFVAGNRIFLYSILDFRAILVFRQVIEAGCPILSLEQLNESCAAITAVYDCRNGLRTQPVLVIPVVPCLRNSNILCLIYMRVDKNKRLAVTCDRRCVPRNRFLGQRILNHLAICIFRQIGEHDRPLIVSIQFFGVAAAIRAMRRDSDFIGTHTVIVSVILPNLRYKELGRGRCMCIGNGVIITILGNGFRIPGNKCFRHGILNILSMILVFRQIFECNRPILCRSHRLYAAASIITGQNDRNSSGA